MNNLLRILCTGGGGVESQNACGRKYSSELPNNVILHLAHQVMCEVQHRNIQVMCEVQHRHIQVMCEVQHKNCMNHR